MGLGMALACLFIRLGGGFVGFSGRGGSLGGFGFRHGGRFGLRGFGVRVNDGHNQHGVSLEALQLVSRNADRAARGIKTHAATAMALHTHSASIGDGAGLHKHRDIAHVPPLQPRAVDYRRSIKPFIAFAAVDELDVDHIQRRTVERCGYNQQSASLATTTKPQRPPAVCLVILHAGQRFAEVCSVERVTATNRLLPETKACIAAIACAKQIFIEGEDMILFGISHGLQFRLGAFLKYERFKRAAHIQQIPGRTGFARSRVNEIADRSDSASAVHIGVDRMVCVKKILTIKTESRCALAQKTERKFIRMGCSGVAHLRKQGGVNAKVVVFDIRAGNTNGRLIKLVNNTVAMFLHALHNTHPDPFTKLRVLAEPSVSGGLGSAGNKRGGKLPQTGGFGFRIFKNLAEPHPQRREQGTGYNRHVSCPPWACP
nr:MAG TPA: hypothetical protein [Caudoviricetes sp.]